MAPSDEAGRGPEGFSALPRLPAARRDALPASHFFHRPAGTKSISPREGHAMSKLYYQGHGSYRLTTDDGRVVYLDPYVGDGYDKPADVVLITHQHSDHNRLELVARKPGCRVVSNKEALEGGVHNTFDLGGGLTAEAVEACNPLHSPEECVGFILGLDGLKIYCSGDTSKTAQMATFAARWLDYAIFCGDGKYNMGPEEAAECARLVGAGHNLIIHVSPGNLFDRSVAEKWDAPNKLIVEPGEEITL